MTRFLLPPLLVLLLGACATPDGDARALDLTLNDYSSGMRWNGLATQVQFMDPDVLREHPPSSEVLQRLREVRVARYFPQPPTVGMGGTATQLVEIELIDQTTQTVSSITQVLDWRWDEEDQRWWLMTPPPDLTGMP